MKKFLAVYTGSKTSVKKSEWDNLDPATRKQREQAGIAAWGQWMETHKDSIVAHGGPLGKTKRTDANGVTDTSNNLAGYIIVQAESQQAAAKLFEGHPHFAIFPGDAVEIMECLPIPGQ